MTRLGAGRARLGGGARCAVDRTKSGEQDRQDERGADCKPSPGSLRAHHALQGLYPQPGEDRCAQVRQEQRARRHAEPAHAGYQVIERSVETELGTTRKPDGQTDEYEPSAHQFSPGMPASRHDCENQRHQADREDRFPVVIPAEVVGRSAQRGRIEQLKPVERLQVIPPGDRVGGGRTPAAQEPGPDGELGDCFDGSQTDGKAKHTGSEQQLESRKAQTLCASSSRHPPGTTPKVPRRGGAIPADGPPGR